VSVRVVIADDNLIAREGILQLLALEPAFEVVAACGDLPEVLEAVDREAPDAVLTDIRMPPSHTDEGIRIANQLRKTHPDVGVIVLSQYDEPMYALSLLESGSDRRGYLLKERVHDAAELRDAVQAVVRGGAVIDSTVVDTLVKGKEAIERSALAELSPRERQVLAEIAQGKSNAAIAESLVLTKRAVEKHINSIFLKLGLGFADDVSKRVKATLMFLAESDLSAPAAAGND
jgi:DNA-binding NarL/FixJ family response regulator